MSELKKKAVLLALFSLFSFFIMMQSAIASTNVTNCTNLNTNGETYYLTQDAVTNGDVCFNIQANDTILDCQGHWINNTKSVGYGQGIFQLNDGNPELMASTHNATIKNCRMSAVWGNMLLRGWGNTLMNNIVYNGSFGIDLNYGHSNTVINNTVTGTNNALAIREEHNNTVRNNTLSNNRFGNFLTLSYDNNIIDNTIQYNWGYGIIGYRSWNNNITNNRISYNRGGITLQGAKDNILKNNIITDNNDTRGGIYVYLSLNNTIYNNFFSNNVNTIIPADDGCVGTETSCSNLQSVCEYWSWSGADCCSYFGCGWNGSVCTGETSVNCFNELFTADGECQYATNCTPVYNMTNYWNTTYRTGTRIFSKGISIGGNYWTNPSGTGYSNTCTDTNIDGLCDLAFSTGGGYDYLPLSDKYSPRFSTVYPLGGLLVAVLLPIVIGLFAYKLFSEKMEISIKGFVGVMIIMLALIVVAIGFSIVFGII